MNNIDFKLLYLVCSDEEVSDVSDNVSDGQVVDTPAEPEAPSTFNVDGKEYTPEQIRQFESAYNNYNSTMQSYKEMEAKSKEAIELYDYLKSNQELSQKLYEFEQELQNGNSDLKEKLPSKEKEDIRNLRLELQTMKIEQQMNMIKSNDPNINEAEVYDLAIKNNLDLDMAYNVWRGQNFDKYMKQELAKQSKKMTDEISKNGQITKTLIGEGDKGSPDNGTFGLSQAELDMCSKLEMLPKEYAEWKSKTM